jgi:hypothetical protein
MNTYKRCRILPDIISYAVWLHYRFNLSHPDKRNRFSRDSSNALGGYSLGSGGEAVAES